MTPVSEGTTSTPVRTARVEVALQAFRDAERVRLLLDKKERDLRLSLYGMSQEEITLYLVETEKVLREYEAKREKEVL